RVDGTAEGYPREEGEFAQTPNYLYKVRSSDFPLEGGHEVRFTLDRGEGKDLVTAECLMLGNIIPQGGLAIGGKLDFPTNRDVSFRWRAGEEARIFDLTLFINYQEKFAGDPTVYERTLEWPM
ncbi:hypothetical protein RZS08_29070, partial [Arthrospira platensis SPKY1]|nr:hypothetical protein [Arthrospira platensis SPKY1]